MAIDPTALLPGAAPPVKAVEPGAVGFDEPAKVDTLQSAAKVRLEYHICITWLTIDVIVTDIHKMHSRSGENILTTFN